jgi:hypothetical protein
MDTSAQPGATPNGASTAGPTPMTMARGQEIYEQLLALADKVGAAYGEAIEQINAAHTEAVQGLAAGVQDPLAGIQPDWLSALPSTGAPDERLADAQERATAIGDNLTDTSFEVGLAYLDAVEKAALAAAKCHEQLGVLSGVDLVKSTAKAHAGLIRQVTQAYTAALRDLAE